MPDVKSIECSTMAISTNIKRTNSTIRAFHQRAYKYALDNLLYSEELLKYAEVINWEHREDATIDS